MTSSFIDNAYVETLMRELMSDVLRTSQAMVEQRLRDLGLLSTTGENAPLTYPVMVAQNGRPVGVSPTLNFMGSGVQASWDQAGGGQITLLIAGEDTFELLFITGGLGTPLIPGLMGWLKLGFPATVTNWELTADPTTPGSITVDIQTCTYAAYPAFASICGGSPPSIVSDVKNRSDNLTTWTRSLSRGDYVGFVSSGITGIERILTGLSLRRDIQGYQGG